VKITTSGISKILYLKVFLFFLLVDFFGFLLRTHRVGSFGPGALYNILILFLILIYILSEQKTVFNLPLNHQTLSGDG